MFLGAANAGGGGGVKLIGFPFFLLLIEDMSMVAFDVVSTSPNR